MRRISQRERPLLLVGLAALVVFAFLYFVLLPMSDSAASLSRQVANLDAKIDEAEAMYRGMSAAEHEIDALRLEAAQFFRPSEADLVPDLIREIAHLTSSLGLQLRSVRPDEPETLDPCIRYPVVFRVQSDLGHIARLLYELEQPPHHLWVEGVEIGPSGEGSDLTATLYVAAYTLAPPDEEDDEEA